MALVCYWLWFGLDISQGFLAEGMNEFMLDIVDIGIGTCSPDVVYKVGALTVVTRVNGSNKFSNENFHELKGPLHSEGEIGGISRVDAGIVLIADMDREIVDSSNIAKGTQMTDFIRQIADIDMIVNDSNIQVGVPGPNAQSVTSADGDADVDVEEGDTGEVEFIGIQYAIKTVGGCTRALDAQHVIGGFGLAVIRSTEQLGANHGGDGCSPRGYTYFFQYIYIYIYTHLYTLYLFFVWCVCCREVRRF